MTVTELIAKLQKCNPDAIVVMSSDGEGNSHSPLYDLWEGTYRADSTWSGEMGMAELTEEDIEDGYTEEDLIDGVPAVCLVPTN